MNATHDAGLRSWLDSANDPDCDFPIQNLPFGVFSRASDGEEPRVGIAIGDRILDVSALDSELLSAPASGDSAAAERIARLCKHSVLNPLMAESAKGLSAFRARVSELLSQPSSRRAVEKALVPMTEARLHVPVAIGDYTDFYASVYHATNVGRLFRPDNPLLPNYKYVPIGYHGRASSIVVSGADVRRPNGQMKAPDQAAPVFGASRSLDYEAELGFFIGQPNSLGEPVPIDEAGGHVFGFCLLNDWSARDIQSWEYQPLGPFLAKNFATTISPWLVTAEAVEPYRTAAFARADGDPEPLPYLASAADSSLGGLDLTIEVLIRSEQMRAAGEAPFHLSRGSAKDMYWTVAQLVAHHASNGCNLRTGDLLASGTISGPGAGSQGCLLEITRRGAEPVTLPNGETRKFLQDGDEIVIKGFLERQGFARIGLGDCAGRIVPGGG